MDDFYSGRGEELKQRVLFKEILAYFSNSVQLNLKEMMLDILETTRIRMDTAEMNQFYNKYLKTLRVEVD